MASDNLASMLPATSFFVLLDASMPKLSTLSLVAHCLELSAEHYRHQQQEALGQRREPPSSDPFRKAMPDAFGIDPQLLQRSAPQNFVASAGTRRLLSPAPANKTKHQGYTAPGTGILGQAFEPPLYLHQAAQVLPVTPNTNSSSATKATATANDAVPAQVSQAVFHRAGHTSAASFSGSVEVPRAKPKDTLFVFAPRKHAENMLAFYMMDGYQDVNHALRSNKSLGGLVVPDLDGEWFADGRIPIDYVVSTVKALVFSSRVTQTMRLYRGVQIDKLSNVDLRVGARLYDLGFVSTSRSLHVAQDFCLDTFEKRDDGKEVPKQVIFVITVRPGHFALDAADLFHDDFAYEEKEVILPPRTTMQIRSVARDDDVVWVQADVVEQER